MTADEFRAILKHLEMTQRQAAEVLGFSRVTINHWCKGKEPIRPANVSHIRSVLLHPEKI
jgi:DNA-binding XRE family transcriptional regulator